jgi:hypothetical protein
LGIIRVRAASARTVTVTKGEDDEFLLLLSIEDKGDRQFVDRLMELWKAARKSNGETREANPGPNQKTKIERKPGVAK